jgi:hypothetical protein
MPSDPLAAGATYGSRQSGSFPAAAHRSGSHAAAIPAEDTLPMTTALSADEGLPVSEQLPEAQAEVAPNEPLNAAEVIRRRLGQTGEHGGLGELCEKRLIDSDGTPRNHFSRDSYERQPPFTLGLHMDNGYQMHVLYCWGVADFLFRENAEIF